MDPTFTMIAAGALVLLLLILLVIRLRKPVDRFDDQDAPDPALSPDSGEADISLEATGRRKSKAPRKAATASGCDHHYEMRGFPADRLGTHVIVVCTKCQERQTVPLAEGEQMLRQRDDVRQAIQRARGGDTKG